MRKVVDGKIYDTKKAKLIGEYFVEDKSGADKVTHEGKIYETQKGNYFLYEIASIFYTNKTYEDEEFHNIYPLSIEEANELVQSYCGIEEAFKYFGNLEEA